ncbi:M23 family metallopeptidase [Desulfococcaceae bacterium HSG8]|nr:M23 family metallopeptidase [Desulfococcaceae bacterium HSG8]
MKNVKLWLILSVCIFIILPLILIFPVKLEGEKPSVSLDLKFPSIGASKEISVSVSDTRSGIRRVWIGLLKGDREYLLLEKDFPSKGLLGGKKVTEESFKISVDPKKSGILDGKAVLFIIARDYSWRGWWNGNKTLIEKEVMIDTKRPGIDVLNNVLNISQGGSGVVIYKLSEPCASNGVHVGENFFPGYSAKDVIGSKEANIFMSLIALDYKQGPETDIFVKATDHAGNITSAGFRYYVKGKKFREDSINISDKFLNWKMPEFESHIQDSQSSRVEQFLMINDKLRKSNYQTFAELGRKSDNILYWKGSFLRFPGKRMAGFADHRKYKYNGKTIDRQVHMGIDIASVSKAEVPASNNGKVVLAKYLGIYGKSVMIDHGFGLFTTYSHLSRINVKEGQIVSRGEIVGNTGLTGLAGGDHLHFGVLVSNIFVNPIEWWDSHWIKDNVSDKINEIKSLR